MTQAEGLLAYFDANRVKYELIDGRVKLTGARRVPAEMIARARQSRDDIARLLVERGKAPAAEISSSAPQETAQQAGGHPLWRKFANARNSAAELRGECDRYCACQSLAQSQWRDRRTGRLLWICDDCLDPATVSGPIILQRSWKSRRHTPIAIELRHVPPPAESTRDRWWEEPVHGWADGRLFLRNMIRDVCVEIQLRRDPA